VIKSRRLRTTGYVAVMWGIENVGRVDKGYYNNGS
jgi:hypothetical protein